MDLLSAPGGYYFILKGQVTFFETAPLVVWLSLIIPRFTLFLLTAVFRQKTHLYARASVDVF